MTEAIFYNAAFIKMWVPVKRGGGPGWGGVGAARVKRGGGGGNTGVKSALLCGLLRLNPRA